MDPKEQRSRSPSLLDADSGEPTSAAKQDRILSGFQGEAEQPSTPTRSRRWLWPSMLVLVGGAAVLMLVLGGAFDGAAQRPPARVASVETAPAMPDEGMPNPAVSSTALASARSTTSSDVEGYTSPDAAVILSGHADAGMASDVAAPAPATSVSKDAKTLSELFSPAPERRRPVPMRRATRRAAPADDSDVALLTALIRHVEVGSPASRKALGQLGPASQPLDPIEVRMQSCPPANSEAGLKCRQKLCAGHSGQAAACPASAPDGV
ncbi:hypothetical protein ACVWWQ_002702 [Rhodanobacter sp. TND4EL1]